MAFSAPAGLGRLHTAPHRGHMRWCPGPERIRYSCRKCGCVDSRRPHGGHAYARSLAHEARTHRRTHEDHTVLSAPPEPQGNTHTGPARAVAPRTPWVVAQLHIHTNTYTQTHTHKHIHRARGREISDASTRRGRQRRARKAQGRHQWYCLAPGHPRARSAQVRVALTLAYAEGQFVL